MKKVFSFDEELHSIDKTLADVEHLKPSAITHTIKSAFCKMYAIAVAKMLNDFGIKGTNESEENNIYFFDKKRSNRFYHLKNGRLIGIGFRRYKEECKDPFGMDLIKYDGYYYEFWYCYEDSFLTTIGYKDGLNYGILQLICAYEWKDIYNCLRIERNCQSSKKHIRLNS